MSVAKTLVNGLASLMPSDKPYDWLGPGIYFWESDYQRAMEWSNARCSRPGDTPAVVGAVIDLGNCLDLLTRTDQDIVRSAHASLATIYAQAGKPLPVNENIPRGGDADRKLRKLDCAVIRHLHEAICSEHDSGLPPFDTVRGMFTEGERIYEGSGFHAQSHVQIAVRNPRCIKGVFLPPELNQTISV